VALAELAGVGRNGQATPPAIQIARGIVEWERRASGGWAGSVDRHRPEPGRLSRARVGRLGQLANWAKQALANYFKTKFQIQMLFPFWIQTKLKNSNNSNKTLSYSLIK
jgi:hypothetical protein